MSLVIFTVRKDVESPVGGSSIRIKGYTCYLKELGVSYIFVAPVRPPYVDSRDYVSFNLSVIGQLFITLHNILNQVSGAKFISSILKYLILKNSEIKKLAELSKHKFILSHQNGSIALFLKLVDEHKFIYDVHGIRSLQREYLDGYSLKNRLLFYLSLAEEKYVCKYADIINVPTKRTLNFISCNYKTQAKFASAPDGLLRQNFQKLDQDKVKLIENQLGVKKCDKVIFFAGSFKKFGGVHFLVDAFCELAGQMTNLKLLLIGTGQMENYVIHRIKAHRLEKRFIHIKQIEYSLLPYYQEFATLIICPDTENSYNELVPHIKIFDSIASKKPVIATSFKVLQELFPTDNRFIKYCHCSSINDLRQKIVDSLFDTHWFRKADNKLLTELTYRRHAESLIEQYRALKILN